MMAVLILGENMNQKIDSSNIVQLCPDVFAPRKADSHKGTFGTLGIIGGAQGMVGAALMAGASALYGGCGKVLIGFAQNTLPMPVWNEMPEMMMDIADNTLNRQDISTWVVGCGMGQSRPFFLWMENILLSTHFKSLPMVLDADALNILAKLDNIAHSNNVHVLTPHPMEAARLLNVDVEVVNEDRISAAVCLAQKYTAWVVLKGQHTIIASAQGDIYINQSGNPNLATAGTGDILAGLIGSLLAQSIPIEQAVCAAVWLHGQAADNLAQEGMKTGLRAMELCRAIRKLRNQLINTEGKEHEMARAKTKPKY